MHGVVLHPVQAADRCRPRASDFTIRPDCGGRNEGQRLMHRLLADRSDRAQCIFGKSLRSASLGRVFGVTVHRVHRTDCVSREAAEQPVVAERAVAKRHH